MIDRIEVNFKTKHKEAGIESVDWLLIEDNKREKVRKALIENPPKFLNRDIEEDVTIITERHCEV
jgi:hypothetical protein